MKKNLNEFLFSLYLSMFMFSKIFISWFPAYSFYFLLFPCLIILLTSLIVNLKEKNNGFKISLAFGIITITITLLMLLSMCFNPNNYIGTYFYEFIIYGVVTLYLFSKIKNIKAVINYMAILSVLNFFIYLNDPFNNYTIFGDYMGFGLNCMLPIFCFVCTARKIFHKKIYFIVEIASLVMLLLFCNRGAFLTACVLEFLFIFINDSEKKNQRIMIKYFILLILLILIVANLDRILLFIVDFLEKINFNSYSIKAFYQMLFENRTGLSGREFIWENSLSFFSESLLFGHGIGAFESKYGYYAHNLIFEILNSFGLIGIVVIFALTIKYICKIIKCHGDIKYIYILFFVIGIVPLMLSVYTYKWPYYWVFLFLAIEGKERSNVQLVEGSDEK